MLVNQLFNQNNVIDLNERKDNYIQLSIVIYKRDNILKSSWYIEI